MVHNDENNDSLSEIGGKEETFFDVIVIVYQNIGVPKSVHV